MEKFILVCIKSFDDGFTRFNKGDKIRVVITPGISQLIKSGYWILQTEYRELQLKQLGI